ncbi:MAG: holo-ACP synthase [Clostridiales bacterium]|nr:holo-ACP synthase [Clostridiales bacterium]
MKIRTGTDIVAVSRIEKILKNRKDSFLLKCFTDQEREYAESFSSPKRQAEIYSARFAAKEAAAKALGTGLCIDGITFLDFEVSRDPNGAPGICFHGRAEEIARGLRIISASLSLSHENEYAVAVCTLLTDEKDS